jgi:hypothetical protein
VIKQKEDDCWEWQAGDNGQGYGRFRVDGKKTGAHRFVWELYYGPPPSDLMVCHKCDNPGCVNPDHLFLGTNQDNMLDMVAKGRNRPRLGEANNKAKLTKNKVLQIRSMYASGNYSQRDLAAVFDVGQPCIKDVVNYITWKHIP